MHLRLRCLLPPTIRCPLPCSLQMDRILFSGPHNCEQVVEERRHRGNVADCLKTASDVYSFHPSQLSVGTLGPLSTFIAAVTERAQAPSGQSPIFYEPERGGKVA